MSRIGIVLATFMVLFSAACGDSLVGGRCVEGWHLESRRCVQNEMVTVEDGDAAYGLVVDEPQRRAFSQGLVSLDASVTPDRVLS